MKKIYKILSILAIPSILLLYSYSAGSPGGKTGSLGDDGNNCTDCHGDFDPVEQNNWISSDIGFQGFLGGETYDITVTGVHEAVVKMGFELTVENGEGEKLGGFTITDADRTQFTNDDNAVTHTQAGNVPDGDSNSWTVSWTAPDFVAGDVVFSAAVNAANGNGTTSGDQIYLVTFVTFQNTAGIAENLLAEKVNIWPNPSSDFVNVSMPAQSSMKIVDMSGRVITSVPKTGEQERIDLNSFTKGIYFVQINQHGTSVSKRLLVN